MLYHGYLDVASALTKEGEPLLNREGRSIGDIGRTVEGGSKGEGELDQGERSETKRAQQRGMQQAHRDNTLSTA